MKPLEKLLAEKKRMGDATLQSTPATVLTNANATATTKPDPTQILSDITVFMKYARYVPALKRRETWSELIERNMTMHMHKYPALAAEIQHVYEEFVLPKKVLPSMRSMQFAGPAIEKNPARIYNCTYAPVTHIDLFSETMFLLLGGSGVGFSVQKQHVAQLPPIKGQKQTKYRRRYLIGDSIEGWADAIKVLVKSWFHGGAPIEFDYRDIRQKGEQLITAGGKAPGPAPLRRCIAQLIGIFERVVAERGAGTQLRPIEVHDMMCHLADAVLAGGIRRAALISLFSLDDTDMLACKAGFWWELNPQRGRANNSVVLDRGQVTKDEFQRIWKAIELSGSGEPGVFFTNNMDWGTNPCCEIALRPFSMCNLTEINAASVVDQADLDARSRAAAFLGTLQAGYTNFHYLRPIWQQTVEEDALLGVSMTGIASAHVLGLDFTQAAEIANATNREIAARIGIGAARRVTCVKPSGTTSLVLGTSSGIHAWHAPYYLRRVRVGANESIYGYLVKHHPALVEHGGSICICVPQRAPTEAMLRTESPLETLARVKKIATEWIQPGHRDGVNSHNVSCTISVKAGEWPEVGAWMWANRDTYNGISVLPYDGGTYQQCPFEDITAEQYEQLVGQLEAVDLRQVVEEEDMTDLVGEVACAGGACAR